MTAEGDNPTPQDVESATPAVEQPGAVSEAAKKPDAPPVADTDKAAVQTKAAMIENDASTKKPAEVIAQAAEGDQVEDVSKQTKERDPFNELFENMSTQAVIAMVVLAASTGVPIEIIALVYKRMKEGKDSKTKEAQQVEDPAAKAA